ncbi:Hypothetical predicted protein [Podarcis lilfordi]|uniref:Uncharacterized protein n=1 Tax=Podarcis lilfordi TaxID=74358 RepID=A0AA35KD25_9SAUR|nr:Hypothetical predicted protein [Podarcis lilfordi]
MTAASLTLSPLHFRLEFSRVPDSTQIHETYSQLTGARLRPRTKPNQIKGAPPNATKASSCDRGALL